jgi:hypothetical protein
VLTREWDIEIVLFSHHGVIPKLIHKSDIIQGEVVIYLDDIGTEHLTLLVIPKSHILFVSQGSEAGEAFIVSGHVS